MQAAETLIRTAVAGGVELCLANPGTTEMPIVAALDRAPEMRAVLGLHETVLAGAADGYARMAGTPALTLLHLGPGLGNAIANLHNARRARSPLVNLIGEHATWHIAADAPLSCDIETLAAPVSGWVRRSHEADGMARDLADALAAARANGGQVASLILPHDLQQAETEISAIAPRETARPAVADEAVAAAAQALKAPATALILGCDALLEPGLGHAARIAAATGCTLLAERPSARVERGVGRPDMAIVPYLPEQAAALFADFERVVLAGCREPVTFFGWEGFASRLIPADRETLRLAEPHEDVAAALDALAERLSARDEPPARPLERPAAPSGPLTPDAICAIVSGLQPENAIIVDEAISSGWSYAAHSRSAPPFSQLLITGGAIGMGLACATGAALARPDSKVIVLQADGSGLYGPQALWTQAREGLDIVTLVIANRAYRVLQMELQRAGLNRLGPQASALTQLTEPTIDWVSLSKGFGVPASRVETSEDCAKALADALAEPGPSLIEAVVG